MFGGFCRHQTDLQIIRTALPAVIEPESLAVEADTRHWYRRPGFAFHLSEGGFVQSRSGDLGLVASVQSIVARLAALNFGPTNTFNLLGDFVEALAGPGSAQYGLRLALKTRQTLNDDPSVLFFVFFQESVEQIERFRCSVRKFPVISRLRQIDRKIYINLGFAAAARIRRNIESGAYFGMKRCQDNTTFGFHALAMHGPNQCQRCRTAYFVVFDFRFVRDLCGTGQCPCQICRHRQRYHGRQGKNAERRDQSLYSNCQRALQFAQTGHTAQAEMSGCNSHLSQLKRFGRHYFNLSRPNVHTLPILRHLVAKPGILPFRIPAGIDFGPLNRVFIGHVAVQV